MFLCEDCAGFTPFVGSYGPCEGCKKMRLCSDVKRDEPISQEITMTRGQFLAECRAEEEDYWKQIQNSRGSKIGRIMIEHPERYKANPTCVALNRFRKFKQRILDAMEADEEFGEKIDPITGIVRG